MLKRIISILLTVLMCMSMVTFTAMADGVVTVTYLNADSTKIMVDLSAEVAVADLKAAITLTADGNAVTDFEVKKMPATPTATGGMTASEDYSYVIIPEDGITFDEVYNLKIASSLLGTESNKYFSVKKLWKEDFESDAYATALPWTTAKSDSKIALEAVSGDTMLKITKGSNRDTILPKSNSTTVFADTGVAANTFWTTAKSVTDYNVEMNVKFVNPLPSGTTARSMRVSMQKQFQDADQSWVYGIAGGAYYQVKSDGTNIQKNMYAQIGNGTTTANGTKYEGAGATSNLVSALYPVSVSQEPFGADDSTFTMAVKKQNIKVFAGDNAFISYDFVPTISDNGIVGIVPYVATPFYVDDIIATKMTELELTDISVNYWNADSTKIMVDLSAEVDAAALANAVTLKKDGSSENFTVEAKPSTPTATGGMTASTDYSYVIKPQGGINFGSVYELNIAAGLISKNKLSILSENYKKQIIVEKLWKEDFESEAYATALPWTTAKSDSTIALEAVSGDTMLKITKGSSRDTILPKSNSTTAFADTGVAANTFWETAKNVTDYNVEMNVKFVNPLASGTTARSLRVSMQKSFNDADQSWVHGIAGGAYYQINSAGANIQKNMYAQIGNGTKGDDGKTTVYQGAGATINLVANLSPVSVSQEPFGSDDSSFTMAVKEQNIKVFAGDAYISYDFTYTISDNGIVGIVPYVASQFYVDDIVVTKAKEVVTPDFGTSLNVVDAEEGKVNVSWEYDGKGNNLPCKVILACYGENNSLKNVIPWDGTNLSGNGTITFENFELKGGTELKLFVWKDLTTLYPYCATVQWPQAD